MDAKELYERYQRQIILKGFGLQAQEKLARTSVLVIGAGGLGCPALQYLAAMGIGTIGIVDHDIVSLSNLHRQILFNTNDIGQPKVEVARKRLADLNSNVRVNTWQQYLDQNLAIAIFPGYDVIVDATDNFATRYLINDAAVLFNKPLVYGAISQFEGQVTVLNVSGPGDAKLNYRDLFPEPPANYEIVNCAEAGVLGVLPGIIGNMQAMELIKLVTGIGDPLINKMLNYNALTQEVYILELEPSNINTTPPDIDSFRKMDYELFCNRSAVELETEELTRGWQIIDVREYHEQPELELPHRRIPLALIEESLDEFPGQQIIFICQSGFRSLQAVKVARKAGIEAYSFKGGMNRYILNQKKVTT